MADAIELSRQVDNPDVQGPLITSIHHLTIRAAMPKKRVSFTRIFSD